MDRHSPRGNRETPETPLPVGGRGRLGKVLDQTPNMHVSGESDGLIVPEKQANKVGPTPAAESVEGRGSAKGNVARQAADRTQSRAPASSGLSGVRKAATPYHHAPEARAVCGSSSRTDPCGGWPERAIPTATTVLQSCLDGS